MGKIIVAIAMTAEINPDTLQAIKMQYPHLTFVHTGVGKVKAAYAITDAIEKAGKVDYVLNCGTSGGRNVQGGEVVYCNKFFQKDMNIAALNLKPGVDLNTNYGFKGCEIKEDEYGQFITHKNLNLPFKNVICATADSFTNDESPTLPELEQSVEEMEAYAIAFVCKQKGIDFAALKYVSNGLGNETSLEEQCAEFDADVKEGKAENALVNALKVTLDKLLERSVIESFEEQDKHPSLLGSLEGFTKSEARDRGFSLSNPAFKADPPLSSFAK